MKIIFSDTEKANKYILEIKLSRLDRGLFVGLWEELSVTCTFGTWSAEWRMEPFIKMGEQ